jgi:GDP-L-fucose synthase
MILVLGATGFLGKRVIKKLEESNLSHYASSLSLGCDLMDSHQTNSLFEMVKPEYVINCSAFVGGIDFGYSYPADLFLRNTMMTVNILESSKNHGVRRLINPISNCAYPGEASLFKESEFWDGPLHESVQVYGSVRKLSTIGSWAYAKQHNLDVINLILSNMYGPGDHFEEKRSHALGALIMKMVKAKLEENEEVIVWGTGSPVREWMFVDDGAESLVRAMDIPKSIDLINIGVGKGISIIDLANLIKLETRYEGKLVFDKTKPDGAPFKTVDGSNGKRIFNWSPEKDFKVGIKETVKWYENSIKGVVHEL